MAKQKFKLVYVKNGALCGSYSGIPGDGDVILITRRALEGLESPIPEGYIIPEGVLEITENGEVDIAAFKKVIVNIPAEVPTGSIEINANGEHNVAGKATAIVNVPGATTKDLFEITENNTYNIAEYARVSVDVPNPSTGILNINTNGEYDVTEKAGVNVAVPQPSGKMPNPIIANGTNINVKDFETVDVNVPIPEGYVIPTGKIEINENGTDIDVAGKAAVDVNIPDPTSNLNTYDAYTYLGDGEFRSLGVSIGTNYAYVGNYDATLEELSNGAYYVSAGSSVTQIQNFPEYDGLYFYDGQNTFEDIELEDNSIYTYNGDGAFTQYQEPTWTDNGGHIEIGISGTGFPAGLYSCSGSISIYLDAVNLNSGSTYTYNGGSDFTEFTNPVASLSGGRIYYLSGDNPDNFEFINTELADDSEALHDLLHYNGGSSWEHVDLTAGSVYSYSGNGVFEPTELPELPEEDGFYLYNSNQKEFSSWSNPLEELYSETLYWCGVGSDSFGLPNNFTEINLTSGSSYTYDGDGSFSSIDVPYSSGIYRYNDYDKSFTDMDVHSGSTYYYDEYEGLTRVDPAPNIMPADGSGSVNSFISGVTYIYTAGSNIAYSFDTRDVIESDASDLWYIGATSNGTELAKLELNINESATITVNNARYQITRLADAESEE